MSYSFCPKCGEKTNQSGLCQKCLISEIQIPVIQPIKKCNLCPLFFFNNRWQELNQETLSTYLKKQLKKFSPSLLSFSLSEENIQANLSLFSGTSEFTTTISIPISKSICDSCMKIKSDYYEAFIQLRGDIPLPESPDIIRIQKTKGGQDIFFLTKKKAISYSKKLPKPKEIKYSSSVVGMLSSGKNKKKYTILLRY